MPRLILAPEARLDLREIRDHIAKDNPKAARRVVTRLRDMARLLAGAPAIGRGRSELGAELRSSGADRYVLFYRSPEGGVDIGLARAFHGARDDAIFTGDEG